MQSCQNIPFLTKKALLRSEQGEDRAEHEFSHQNISSHQPGLHKVLWLGERSSSEHRKEESAGSCRQACWVQMLLYTPAAELG